MEIVYTKKLREEVELPKRATEKSAGADLRACLYDEVTGEKITKIVIPAQGVSKIHTGLAFQTTEKHFMMLDVRSSSGIKKGLALQNTIGILDEDYTGECILFVKNTTDEPVEILNGERIAQAIIIPYLPVEYVEVEDLKKTERGNGGFGSTGKF